MNRFFKSLLFIFFPVFAVPLLFGQSSNVLVQNAWDAWNKNDQKETERLFREALKTDEHNIRAGLGLSYLYSLQDKRDESWTEFNNALNNMPEKYPYVYSAWLTPKFLHNSNKAGAGIIGLLESIAEDPKTVRDLSASACDILGDYYESKNNLAKARGYYSRENTVDEWTLIGPFENISASGFDQAFPPEKEYNPASNYEGKSGTPVWWFKIPAIRNDRWIDLTFYFSYSDAIFYGNTFVFSPVRQKAWIRIGTSGSLKAFLNDEIILQCFDENNNDLDTYIAETELQEGWNRLLIKCGYSEISQCNFKVRITDTLGRPIAGMKIAADPQKYRTVPGAAVRQIPNFAEEYFKNKIQAAPKEMENYLLLADCYLRNDKAIEAELILRDALKIYPDCSAFYKLLLEAYVRGEKSDEQSKILEKLTKLDNQIPAVLSYKIDRSIQNEEYEETDRLIEGFGKLRPGSEELFQHKIDLYSKRNYVEKLTETVNEAVAKYPENWQFTYLKAYIASQLSRKPMEAVKILQSYLEKKYDRTALYYLSDFYLQSADMDNWEKSIGKLLELQPAAPGYRFQMANIYTSAQNMVKAEAAISDAINICPGSSTYWGKRGEIFRMKGDTQGAISAYREALRLNQSNQEARDALRELENRESAFASFDSVDIHSHIANAPAAADYPNDPAVYLLDDIRRVVYERGASEYSREILIKVFNNRGIDIFKEYSIGYNSYNEKLIIDKAAVIKKDGSEIKADLNENQVIFKSLEPDDFVYLKFRIRKLYGGRLAKHFWDSYHFNYFYPIKLLRYSLLVPEGTKFQHTAQNMPDVPVIKKTRDGILYSWSVTNEPAVDDEPGMPLLKDTGKMLHISSIESWREIENWFTDIAQTKTRTSFEIKEQVDSLLRDKGNISEEEKAEIIYNFITEHIRYSSVSFRQSGLIPQKARDVLVTRIGDCKDVATLCIAMLHEAGIKAYYVLVNTRDEGTGIKSLPNINFNHCIAAIDLPGGLQFCDLTANHYAFKTLPEADMDGYYLLIRPNENEPHYFNSRKFPARCVYRKTNVVLNEDNSAEIKREFIRSGAASALYREYYYNKSRKDQEQEITNSLMRDFPSVKLNSFELFDIDKKKATTGLNYSCNVPQLLSEAGQYKILKIPWTDAIDKWPALSRDTRTYPVQYWVDVDTLKEEITIQLPEGYKAIEAESRLHYTNPIADYTLQLNAKKNTLTGYRMMINKKSIILPDEYRKFKEFYNKLVKSDSRQILLKKR